MADHQSVAHATMPSFVVWVQDNILLTLLILASGFVNMNMLITGLVKNIEDPSSWGAFLTLEIIALAAAGLGLGGLSLRISYKIAVCYVARQWGRVVFLALGMATMAFIEFWAAFSQRAANIPSSPADNTVLSLFNIHNPNISFTAILIALVIPFASIFWGFAADDPAPKVIESADDLQRRHDNEYATQQHKSRMMAAKANAWGGMVKGAVNAAQGTTNDALTNTPTAIDDDDLISDDQGDEALISDDQGDEALISDDQGDDALISDDQGDDAPVKPVKPFKLYIEPHRVTNDYTDTRDGDYWDKVATMGWAEKQQHPITEQSAIAALKVVGAVDGGFTYKKSAGNTYVALATDVQAYLIKHLRLSITAAPKGKRKGATTLAPPANVVSFEQRQEAD